MKSWIRLGVSLVAYVVWDGAERLLSRRKGLEPPKPVHGHATHIWRGEAVYDSHPPSYAPNPLPQIMSPDEWREFEARAEEGASQ